MANADRVSKPIRVSNKNLSKLSKFKENGESWDSVLGHLLSESALLWALPDDLFTSKAKAKGESLKRVAKKRGSLEGAEAPVRIAKL